MKNRIPILMYHEIIDSSKDNSGLFKVMERSYFVDKALFEEQLSLLRSLGFKTVPLLQLVRWIKDPASADLPERAVILTFDDGYAGNYEHAFPLLKKYGFTAEFFITTGSVDKPLMMKWGQLREMAQAGMSIQSHTVTHPFLKQLSDAQVEHELRSSGEAIEKNLNTKAVFISLPHGSINANYVKIAQKAGYSGGCGSEAGLNGRSADIYRLRRIHVAGSYGIKEFKKIVTGDGYFVSVIVLKKKLKTFMRALIGEKLYLGIYRLIFGLKGRK